MGVHHHHHHHNHSHHHHHHDDGETNNAVRNIGFAFFLNLSFTIIELVGGLYTGSVAILSDALHDFGDSIALGMAMVIEKLAGKGATPRFSYGYRRLSLVSAALTSILLVSGTIVILYEAIPRLSNPSQPKVGGMIFLAILGIAVNGAAAARVWGGKTMNERAVSWHMIEDVLGWVVILIGSIVMSIWDLPIIDPILSIAFSIFILIGVMRNLKHVFHLFLQAVPTGLDVPKIREHILSLPHVQDVHDVHVWSLDGDSHVMTMHAVVAEELSVLQVSDIKNSIRTVVNKFGKLHLTLEIERPNEHCPDHDCGAS